MNLLSLIIIFLALAICGSIAYIAWDLTDERHDRPDRDRPGDKDSDQDSDKTPADRSGPD